MAKKGIEKFPEQRPSIHVVQPEIEYLRGHQSHAVGALDTKAGVVLGFSGAILAVLVNGQPASYSTAFAIGTGLVLLAVISAAAAMAVHSFRFDPNPQTLLHDYMLRQPDSPTTGAREQILADKVDAYYKNEKIITRKGRLINAAVVFLGVGVILQSTRIFRRESMTTANTNKSTSAQPAPKPAEPAPVAQPNPNASNTIKKGLRPGSLEK